jgi:hypothetical protein
MNIINMTENFPEKLLPGMQPRFQSVQGLTPDKIVQMEAIAKAPVSDWGKALAGKRGLDRLRKIAALLFGTTSMVEHVKLESHGVDESLSIVCIRVPLNV